MKKVILVSLVSSLLSAAAVAEPNIDPNPSPDKNTHDATSATLTWKADVPVIVPGHWITFTGEGSSMTLQNAGLNLRADGSYESEKITLELHTYDEKTGTPGDLIQIGQDQFNGITANKITYQVMQPEFSSQRGTDLSSIDSRVLMNDNVVPTEEAIESVITVTDWFIKGSGVTNMIGGDTISATTVVRADVEFAEVGGQ